MDRLVGKSKKGMGFSPRPFGHTHPFPSLPRAPFDLCYVDDGVHGAHDDLSSWAGAKTDQSVPGCRQLQPSRDALAVLLPGRHSGIATALSLDTPHVRTSMALPARIGSSKRGRPFLTEDRLARLVTKFLRKWALDASALSAELLCLEEAHIILVMEGPEKVVATFTKAMSAWCKRRKREAAAGLAKKQLGRVLKKAMTSLREAVPSQVLGKKPEKAVTLVPPAPRFMKDFGRLPCAQGKPVVEPTALDKVGQKNLRALGKDAKCGAAVAGLDGYTIPRKNASARD